MSSLIEIVGQPPSADVRQQLADAGSPVMLAFSGGKDSIAAWLALQDAGVQVVPYYLYYIPGLRFIESAMTKFEELFAARIHRYPHPSLFRWLNNFTFQSPERLATIDAANFPKFTHEQVLRMIRTDLSMPDAWTADGVRAADSIVRRTSFATHGVWKQKQQKVSVVWDWRKAAVLERISAAGIQLPVDYEWFGRSFDGLDYRFLEPLKRNAPDDYERILDWFPLAGLELVRHDL